MANETWFPLNNNVTIYTPSGNSINAEFRGYLSPTQVNPNLVASIYIGDIYHDTQYRPSQTEHAKGIQCFTLGTFTVPSNVSKIYMYSQTNGNTPGISYGTKWGFTWDISGTSAIFRLWGKFDDSSDTIKFKSANYVFTFCNSSDTVLGYFKFYLDKSNNSVSITGFKINGYTVPNSYNGIYYINDANGGTQTYYKFASDAQNTYYAPWLFKRYLCVSDSLYNQSGYPLLQKDNGLWYVYDGEFYLVNGDGVVYDSYNGIFNIEIKYAHYTGVDDSTYEVRSLGEQQAGSTYTAPASSEAGAMLHYTFSNWKYNGTDVSPGSTFKSYPSAGGLSSTWSAKSYTVSFQINVPGTVPSSINPMTGDYSSYIMLPSLTAPSTHRFDGWSDGISIYLPGAYYQIKGDITLTAVIVQQTFTVRFFDADGTEIPGSSQTVTYPATVNIPKPDPTRPNFTFQGWASKGSVTPILASNVATTYQPTYNVDLIRVYKYTLTLSWQGGSSTAYDSYFSQGMSITVPKHDSNNRPILNGYRFSGWAKTYTAPALNSNPTPDYDSGTVPITLSTNFNTLYATYRPATLTAVSTTSHSLNVRVGETVNIGGNSISFQPSDWKGSLEWTSQGNDNYFSITPHANDNGADIYGVSTTQGAGAYAVIRGYKETWNTSEGYVSASIYITVSDYIQVTFHTRNELGEDILYGVYSVDDSDGFSWLNGDFPTDPTRPGFIFDGWVDAEGNTITINSPPHYPIDVYATWLSTYTPADRDVLILQKFSNDGSSLEYSIDMGVVADMTETFSLSLNTMPTPTKSSDNTFITDLYVTETIKFDITRKNPVNPNDTSDNPLAWSNGYWLERIRGLVDRWQSESDGIKALYIPRGLKYSTINGERVYHGDNYDLLGYVKLRNDNGTINSGLLYDTDKVLVGYNGIITVYNDTYTAGTPNTITVSLTITLGGMQAGYEDLSRSLLNMG